MTVVGHSSDPASPRFCDPRKSVAPVKRVLVSACLLGESVRYDGGHLFIDHPLIARWRDESRLVAVCPEMAGGLPVPRPAAETLGGDGRGVLDGVARVIARNGQDVSSAFVAGAEQALAVARRNHCVLALLAARSPSCGNRQIYDGSFTGQLIEGQGVTAALLERSGVRVFNQFELEDAERYLNTL
ncbi:MAG: purine-nucleoside phosphorylase [Alteromonadaceae bacterium]|nr:purine-nucleoside phosphorylase [Alteromonadaceae bacterium]MBH84659.1 purine-nucleoside phosphorylase [Alteromonadaceae bacterium]